MAKQPTRPELKHCKVTQTTHPKAPWRVAYPAEQDGQQVRLRKMFASEDRAWEFAQKTDLEISNHGVRFGGITPEGRRAFDFFRDESAALREIGADVPSFEDLIKAALADIRTRHAQKGIAEIPVAEGVALFLDYKKSRVGPRQYADLADRLRRFAEDFGDRPFSAITTAEIEFWLSSLRSRRNPGKLAQPPLLAPLSRNHYRAALSAIFGHGAAPARAWCQRNPLADLEPEQVAASEPQAYPPEAARLVMQAALDFKPELVPALALGMFGGLRVSEALVFDLSKLTPKAKEFRVSGGKTGARIVPFLESCKAWIFAQPRRDGPAFTQSARTWVDEVAELFTLAGIEQIDNGARHSFISYRCADTRNTAQVADECGNSPGVVKAYYRQIVTAAAAKKFFAIRPAKVSAEILPFRATA